MSETATTENKIDQESALEDWTTMEVEQESRKVEDIPLENIEPVEQHQEQEQGNHSVAQGPENINLTSDLMVVDQPQCSTSDKDMQIDSVKGELWDFDLTEHFTTDKVFEGREELMTWLARMGKETGCVVVIQKSDHCAAGKKPRLFLGCERSGKYRSHKRLTETQDEKKKRKRKSGTKKCDCPFALRGICLPGPHDRWKVDVDCGHHNHPLATDLDGRLTPEEEKVLLEMTISGMKPKEVLDVVKDRDPNNFSKIKKRIYNARAKLRNVEKNGKSQMQQLMPLLDENDYVECHRGDHESDSLTGLFWANPESVQLAKCFPCVFIMESIKKADKHRWPVFEVVGVTSTMVSFSVCFAMFEKGRDDNYLWALGRLHALLDKDNLPLVIVTDGDLALFNSVEKIFPDTKQLLCRWHIQMNVLAKAKNFLDENECKKFSDKWNDMVLSSTYDGYAIQLEALEREFSHVPIVVQFIKDTWLPKREFFISAWTDQYMHLGCTTTSRIESAHARLKSDKCSMFDFVGLWKIMHSMINEQITEIRISFERSLNNVKHEYMIPTLEELRGCIPRQAIDLILAERQRAISTGLNAESCRCVLHSTHGLPCAHEIATYESDERPIPLSSVHSFWKKLSDIPTFRGRGDLDNCLEFQMFVKNYEESDDVRKKYLLKGLKELADSVTPRELTDSVTPRLVEPQEEVELGDQPNTSLKKEVAAL